MAGAWFDILRRTLGWKSSRQPPAIDFQVSPSVVFESRNRQTMLESIDRGTSHESRERPTMFDAARTR